MPGTSGEPSRTVHFPQSPLRCGLSRSRIRQNSEGSRSRIRQNSDLLRVTAQPGHTGSSHNACQLFVIETPRRRPSACSTRSTIPLAACPVRPASRAGPGTFPDRRPFASIAHLDSTRKETPDPKTCKSFQFALVPSADSQYLQDCRLARHGGCHQTPRTPCGPALRLPRNRPLIPDGNLPKISRQVERTSARLQRNHWSFTVCVGHAGV